MYGFQRIALCVPECRVADVDYNCEKMLALAKQAAKEKAGVVVFPELSVTTASCGDMFRSQALLTAAENGVARLLKELPKGPVFVFGTPMVWNYRLFDVAVVAFCHVGFKPVPFLGVVIGNEGDTAAHDGAVLFHNLAEDGVDGVGLVYPRFHGPGHVVGGYLHSTHHVPDFHAFHLQLRLGTMMHLLADATAGKPILNHSRRLNQQSHKDDDSHTRTPP